MARFRAGISFRREIPGEPAKFDTARSTTYLAVMRNATTGAAPGRLCEIIRTQVQQSRRRPDCTSNGPLWQIGGARHGAAVFSRAAYAVVTRRLQFVDGGIHAYNNLGVHRCIDGHRAAVGINMASARRALSTLVGTDVRACAIANKLVGKTLPGCVRKKTIFRAAGRCRHPAGHAVPRDGRSAPRTDDSVRRRLIEHALEKEMIVRQKKFTYVRYNVSFGGSAAHLYESDDSGPWISPDRVGLRTIGADTQRILLPPCPDQPVAADFVASHASTSEWPFTLPGPFLRMFSHCPRASSLVRSQDKIARQLRGLSVIFV